MIPNIIILGIVALAQKVVAYQGCQVSSGNKFPYGLRATGVDQGYSSNHSFEIVAPPEQLCDSGKPDRFLRSTGLYADECSSISIKSKQRGSSCRRLGVQVGNHFLGDLKGGLAGRPRHVTAFTELIGPETILENDYGGVVHVSQPRGCNLNDLSLSITAIEGSIYKVPFYESGVTGNTEWDKEKKKKAPWLEIRTLKTDQILPTDFFINRSGDEMEEMSKRIDNIINLLYNISGLIRNPSAVSITADNTPPNGRGRPIVLSLEQARHLADNDLFKTDLGHGIVDTLASNFFPDLKNFTDIRGQILAGII